MTKNIVVVPYNPEWPTIFKAEAAKIKAALGDNCLAIHHVGSTAVPGLLAKPKIDIIAGVNNLASTIEPLTDIGLRNRGEFNIPLHESFDKRGDIELNLHIYEEGHPEIELNLCFRDYLRNHPEVRDEYANLKVSLLKDSASFEKKGPMFSGYNLGKNAFIRKVLKDAHFNRIRMVHCAHYVEWDAAKNLRNKYFFDPLNIADPYTWTFDHEEHAHLILYQGVEVIGYAHIQFWPEQRAALRIIVVDEAYRSLGCGSQFLVLCERWLKKIGIRSLHDEARPDAVKFYRKNGYVEMPFEDPAGEPPSIQDVALGKIL
ncbi:MAG TPA: bifunctional GrpB family protein/GNAT family N-acetyltransferase [Parachlamydiaceae bacterium]|nr:bifunctional GrpB family protein/GNAT family N-acetyltransferase [Parachlamydiaceae bacterium]